MYTEKNITKDLLSNLVWKQWFHIATHQYTNWFGISDVFWVNKNLFTHEYEIKVSKADFMSEMKYIESIISGVWVHTSEWKYIKHYHYINAKKWQLRWYQLPNSFSYVVPEDLASFCLEKLEDTPYWLFSCRAVKHNSYWTEYVTFVFESLKKPKKIHSEKITFEQLLKISKRLSYVNITWNDSEFYKEVFSKEEKSPI